MSTNKQALRDKIQFKREILDTQTVIDVDELEALLDELEAKDAVVGRLTAERDALRETEMGGGRYSNTRAAADIYFQLVEECEIPPGGSLVEYVDNMRDALAAAGITVKGDSE